MADPLSITTGVLALLQVTCSVGLELKKFHDEALVVDETIGELQDYIDGLVHVLESMRDTFESITAAHGAIDMTSHWNNIARFLEGGVNVLVRLGDEAREINKTTRFLDSARKQLRLNMAMHRIAGYRGQIQSYRDGLQLSLQAIFWGNQTALQTATAEIGSRLIEVQNEIRRTATGINECLRVQAESGQDQGKIDALDNLKECVKSAASIVSSASTVTASQADDGRRDTVLMSDFGDIFPAEQNLTIRRWIQSRSVDESDQNDPQYLRSLTGQLSTEELDGISDSDSDIDDEMMIVCWEKGRQKLVEGNFSDAERLFKNCSSRLSNSTMDQRGENAHKKMMKHLEVLENLFKIYESQERWVSAQHILEQKLNIKGRLNRGADASYLEDVFALAKLFQRKADTVQALLHARRALRGYKKLRDTNGIRLCLQLLIVLCTKDGNEDDREAYAMMLSNIYPDVHDIRESENLDHIQSRTASPSPKETFVQNMPQTEVGKRALPEQLTPTPNRPREMQKESTIVKQILETEDDLLHFETRPGRRGHYHNTRLFEDLSSSELHSSSRVNEAGQERTNLKRQSRSVSEAASTSSRALSKLADPPIQEDGPEGERSDDKKKMSDHPSIVLDDGTLGDAASSKGSLSTEFQALGFSPGEIPDDNVISVTSGESSLVKNGFTANETRSILPQIATSHANSETIARASMASANGPERKALLQRTDTPQELSLPRPNYSWAEPRTYKHEGDDWDMSNLYDWADSVLDGELAPVSLGSETPSLRQPQSQVIPSAANGQPFSAASDKISYQNVDANSDHLENQRATRKFSFELEGTIPSTHTGDFAQAGQEASVEVDHVSPSIRVSSVTADLDTPDLTQKRQQKKQARREKSSKQSEHAEELTIVLIGDGLCGKSSLMQRVLFGTFSERWDLGYHHRKATCEFEDKSINVSMWDMSGQEDFAAGAHRYSVLEYADCILACFAIDFPISLRNLMDKWIPQVQSCQRGAQILLVGCKSEYRSHPETMKTYEMIEQRLISSSECEAARRKIRAFKYLECSAKTNEGVEDVFKVAIGQAASSSERRSLKKTGWSLFNSSF